MSHSPLLVTLLSIFYYSVFDFTRYMCDFKTTFQLFKLDSLEFPNTLATIYIVQASREVLHNIWIFLPCDWL